MKKIIFQFFFFLFFLVPSLIYCQYSFSTDYIELCNWKENIKKWSNDCEEALAFLKLPLKAKGISNLSYEIRSSKIISPYPSTDC